MNTNELWSQIQKKSSYLCVGLDADINKIPKFLLKEEDPIFEFNKRIIDATKDFTVAYKPNIAFYEALGVKGWQSLEKTLNYIPKDIFTIADAKRGDIGNTANLYARAFFEQMNFDSITVAPYMGEDSVKPFAAFEGKSVIVLAATSNKGGSDFQQLKLEGQKDKQLYEYVIEKTREWVSDDQLMFVVGATRPELFVQIRKIAYDNFLLVPGVGAQGGSLKEVSKYGMNDKCGLLVNSSRGIIYASNDESFADRAFEVAQSLQKEMTDYLDLYLK